MELELGAETAERSHPRKIDHLRILDVLLFVFTLFTCLGLVVASVFGPPPSIWAWIVLSGCSFTMALFENRRPNKF